MADVMEAPGVPLTYEAYMAEPEFAGRYDIVNGVRIVMPGAGFRHQRIAGNVEELLRTFERSSGLGVTVSAPLDVLIRRAPRLQTRQPDVLFLSHARLTQGGGIPEAGPLGVAPELVVEVVSDSETQRILEDKITDYVSIGVQECWVIRPDTRRVEVRDLTAFGVPGVTVYDDTQVLVSRVLPGLAVPVAEVFRP